MAGNDGGGAPALIDIRRATVWRNETRVFHDLTLSIAQRESTVLLGPNGAGKTTLMQLLTRKLYPVHQPGSWVRILGRERLSVRDLYQCIGFVSHELQNAFLMGHTGREAVLSGLTASIGTRALVHVTFSTAQHEIAAAVMDRLGVTGLADVRFDRMSTGQQRRILLARSLVHDPESLILDEPASGLDPGAAFRFVDLMREQLRAGRTIVLATHHVAEIPPEIDRVILMKDRRVLRDGAKRHVLTPAGLSELYDTPVDLIERNGFYLPVPGS